ncbi:thiolase family protein [Spongiibacter marinus]|uniref:thiolase family protein n=1 Tax=Spongiibacter marinus TaxID=354246 RepID=UPI0035BE954E
MNSGVNIVGVGMTHFTVHLDKTYHQLCAMAIDEALENAGINKAQLESVFFANSAWGIFEDQHTIRGQCALRPYGLLGVPIINVENACSSASTALYTANMAIKSGEFDVALVVGVEKLASMDKQKSIEAFTSGFDRTCLQETFDLYDSLSASFNIPMPAGDDKGKSKAMETYGVMSRWHMSRFGTTQEQLAKVVVKNRQNGALNPKAHWQTPVSLEEVMNDRLISYPITRPMCAPIGDGAAAAVVVSDRFLAKMDAAKPIKIRAMAHTSGKAKKTFEEEPDIAERLSKIAYEKAGLGPKDIDIAEVHDASAYGEIHQVEALGFVPEGEGGAFIESGKSALSGELPINTSGGLISRGHPVGASGLAQIYELVTQLRGEAGARQVKKDCKIALAENGGGILTIEEASMTISILEKAF